MGQEQTEHLHLPLPDPGGTLEHDVLGLIMAYVMIDMAIHELGQDVATMATQQALNTAMQSVTQALATKASVAQLQAVDQAQTNALQSLVVNTEQALQQLRQDIANKAVHLAAVAQASNAQQAREGAAKIKRLVQETATSASHGQPLVAGVEYALQADAAYSRQLPAGAQLGDAIRLRDPTGDWKLGRITITRGDPAYTINSLADDMLINTNAWAVTLTYAGANNWTLTKG